MKTEPLRTCPGSTVFEVIFIRLQQAGKTPTGHLVPAREVYPRSETWGTDGFTAVGKTSPDHPFMEALETLTCTLGVHRGVIVYVLLLEIKGEDRYTPDGNLCLQAGFEMSPMRLIILPQIPNAIYQYSNRHQ